MIAATLDVNVIVPGFATPSGTMGWVVDRWFMGAFEVSLSEHIVGKAAEVWERPYWAARYNADQVERAVTFLRQRARMVIPDPTIRGAADDEEDDLVLATAVAAGVDVLVTGDHGLLRIESFRAVEIISPRAFLVLLGYR
jgi:predicted nucleic acid-binding protein